MNRKLLIGIAAIAVIAIVAASSFLIVSNDAPHIVMNYTYMHGKQAEPVTTTDGHIYNGTASWVIFTINATSTKDVPVLDNSGFTVTSNGQSLTVLSVIGSGFTFYKGENTGFKIGFAVEGDFNTFELVYNGPVDITIIK